MPFQTSSGRCFAVHAIAPQRRHVASKAPRLQPQAPPQSDFLEDGVKVGSSGKPIRRVPVPRAKDGEPLTQPSTHETGPVASPIVDTAARRSNCGAKREKKQSDEVPGADPRRSPEPSPDSHQATGKTLAPGAAAAVASDALLSSSASDAQGTEQGGFALDVSRLPSLRSSFEDPLLGLSPAFAPRQVSASSSLPGASSPRASGSGASPLTPQEQPPSKTVPLPNHLFNTHRFTRSLESSSFSRPFASLLLGYTNSALRRSAAHHLSGPHGAVSKAHSEGQAYLYSAALGELRTEVQVKARNDGIALRGVVSGLQREVDALTQRLKEDIGTLRGDIQLEMNTRKEETSGDMKGLELSIQELDNKFTILTGELRTEIEARKWITTRRCIAAIAGLALCVILYTASAPPPSNKSKSTKAEEQVNAVKSVEELGISPAQGASSEYVPGEGWVLAGGGVGSKRVGEDEEQGLS